MPAPLISVLFPTTGRPQRAAASVEGLIRSAPGHELEIICAVDADPVTVRLLREIRPPEGVTIILDERDSYRGCSRAWNDALALSSGDPVVFAADDLVWEAGWLDAALAALATFPGGWGLVGFNDGNPGWSTHYLMSRRLIIEVLGGVVAWDCYRHSHNDTEAVTRAETAGRHIWCEAARVTHVHWLYPGASRPEDDTDRRNYAHEAESRAAFEQRKALGFPADYDPVIRS